MTVLIDEEISLETLEKLTKAYNELPDSSKLDIYFSSSGGLVSVGEAMIDLINRNKKRTTVIVYCMLASMGFLLFTRVRCKRVVLSTAYGMSHLTKWKISLSEGGSVTDRFDKFKEEYMKNKLEATLKFYECLGFTEKEMKELRKGKDVYLTSERLEEITKVK